MKKATGSILACFTLAAANLVAQVAPFSQRLSDAAIERTQKVVRYDASYVRIPYPGGDVPEDTGVCTDEIIRVYRTVGIDLQREVHEDILRAPAAYPSARRPPDSNIDHRRVPNLIVFFKRNGQDLSVSSRADYEPGDLVTWDLGHGLKHIGMVVARHSAATGNPMIEHNIGQGPKIEDVLHAWRITGHFRYPDASR